MSWIVALLHWWRAEYVRRYIDDNKRASGALQEESKRSIGEVIDRVSEDFKRAARGGK